MSTVIKRLYSSSPSEPRPLKLQLLFSSSNSITFVGCNRRSWQSEMEAERVITVEYLEPSMSEELLCKFPDASAFGFDYSRSGIWSPLVPHQQASFFSDVSPPRKRRRVAALSPVERLLFREDPELGQMSGVNCSTSSHSRRLKSTTMKVSSERFSFILHQHSINGHI